MKSSFPLLTQKLTEQRIKTISIALLFILIFIFLYIRLYESKNINNNNDNNNVWTRENFNELSPELIKNLAKYLEDVYKEKILFPIENINANIDKYNENLIKIKKQNALIKFINLKKDANDT